jgi:hypothetical protein
MPRKPRKKLVAEKKKRGIEIANWKTFDSESGQSVSESVGVGHHFAITKGSTPEIHDPHLRDGGVRAGIEMVFPGGGQIYTSQQGEEEVAGQRKGAAAFQGQDQDQCLVPLLDLNHLHRRPHSGGVEKLDRETDVIARPLADAAPRLEEIGKDGGGGARIAVEMIAQDLVPPMDHLARLLPEDLGEDL